MGVVSNKINIMEIMKSGGGGDPTIPGRVSALENEMIGVYASINQISTVELPKVYSSISAVSNLILEPVTGLKDRVTKLETNTNYEKIYITNADRQKTNSQILDEFKAIISAYANKCASVELAQMSVGIYNGSSEKLVSFYSAFLTNIADNVGVLRANVNFLPGPHISYNSSTGILTTNTIQMRIQKTGNSGAYLNAQVVEHDTSNGTDTVTELKTSPAETTNIITRIIAYIRPAQLF